MPLKPRKESAQDTNELDDKLNTTDELPPIINTDTAHLNLIKDKIFAPTDTPVESAFGAGSHAGKVRSNNEDHYLLVRRRRSRHVLKSNLPDSFPSESHEDAHVFVVADGIGGGVFGEFASRLALQAGWALGGDEISWSFRLTPDEVQQVLNKIEIYPLLIHKALMREAKVHPELQGMGTTLTGAYVVGTDAFITHVGDSRALLIRDGEVRQLTTDQTLAAYYEKNQDVALSEEELKKLSHVLTSCLGAIDDNVEVETHHCVLRNGDALLLCSDGLTDMVDNDTIARTVTSIEEPQQACDRLIEQALEAGGRDNVTVVLGKFTMPTEENTVILDGPQTPIISPE